MERGDQASSRRGFYLAAGVVGLILLVACLTPLLLNGAGNSDSELDSNADQRTAAVQPPVTNAENTVQRPGARNAGRNPDDQQWRQLPSELPAVRGEPLELSHDDLPIVYQNDPAVRKLSGPPQVVSAGVLSPFFVVEDSVYDARTNAPVGKAAIPDSRLMPIALSPDGQIFAKAELDGGRFSGKVKVDLVDCKTGETASTIAVPKGQGHIKFQFLSFIGNDRLCAIVDHTTDGVRLFVWSLENGRLLQQWPLGRSIGPAAISADGRFLACQTPTVVQVIDLTTGQSVVSLARPQGAPVNAAGTYSTKCLSFSPDGNELAGIINYDNQPQIVVWDQRGQVVDQIRVEQWGKLEWLPDGTGWVVGLHKYGSQVIGGVAVVDRRLRGEVWHLKTTSSSYATALVARNILVLTGRRQRTAVVFLRAWPDAKVRPGVAAVAAGTTVLRPGQPVAVDVSVNEVRHAEIASVTEDLRTAVTKRLLEKGFLPDQNSGTRISVEYGETDGGTITHHRGNPFPTYVSDSTIIAHVLHGSTREKRREALQKYTRLGLVERDGMFLKVRIGQHKIRDGDPGITANSTTGHLELSLKSTDGKVVWQKQIVRPFGGARSEAQITDQTVRNFMFGSVLYSIGNLSLPRVIAVDPDMSALPIVEDLSAVLADWRQ